MTEQRKEKIKMIREKLKALTSEQKDQLVKQGMISTIEGRILSIHNTILLYVQSAGKSTPTIVGGYKQWNKAGKQVKKGEHGSMIFFPVGKKNQEGDMEEVDSFYMATVFDVSQTAPIEDKPIPNLVYSLTGKTGDKCISNGNTWSESVMTPESLASI